MLHCPHPHCGRKNDDCSPYQVGDTCPNGHEITAEMLQASEASTESSKPALTNQCPKCGYKNDEVFEKGDPCPNCHEIM